MNNATTLQSVYNKHSNSAFAGEFLDLAQAKFGRSTGYTVDTPISEIDGGTLFSIVMNSPLPGRISDSLKDTVMASLKEQHGTSALENQSDGINNTLIEMTKDIEKKPFQDYMHPILEKLTTEFGNSVLMRYDAIVLEQEVYRLTRTEEVLEESNSTVSKFLYRAAEFAHTGC